MDKRILSEIWIYPVKALGGIRLTSSIVREKGLQYDRRWMLVDENHIFLTQRDYPKLALFKVTMQSHSFIIRMGHDTITLPMSAESHKDRDDFVHPPVRTVVWDDPVTTFEESRQHSQWFSERLGATCKLVHFPEENPRPVNPLHSIKNEHVSLADGYPFLIIGQASLDNLNEKLATPIPMNRFRPNLVFTGGEPHEEDSWRNFMIGKNRFAGVKPCARCMVPTVNQDTAEKGKEPTATLAGYRSKGGNIYFGQNVLAIDHHEIHEGDEIQLGIGS